MKKTILFLVLIHFFNMNSQNLQWDWVQTNQNSAQSGANTSASDSQGNLYVGGAFNTPTMVFDTYTLNNTSSFGQQIFLAKYSSSGVLLWARTLNHNNYAIIRSMTVDLNDNLIITGDFTDTIILDSIIITNANIGNTTIFLAKVSPSGSVDWATGFGRTITTSGYTYPYDVKTDSAGNIYLTGLFSFSDFMIDGSVSLTSGGFKNFFLLKCSSNGDVLWAKEAIMTGGGYYGGNGTRITVDNNDNVLMSVGFTNSILIESSFLSNTGLQLKSILVAKYNSIGELQLTKKYPSQGYVDTYDIKTDSNNSIYLLGTYDSSPVTFGTITLQNSGYQDIFFTKLDALGNVMWARKIGGIYDESAEDLGINANNVYVSGYFNSPVLTLDTVSLTNSFGTAPISHENGFVAKYDFDGSIIGGSAPQNTGRSSFVDLTVKNDYIYIVGGLASDFTLGNTTLTTTDDTFFAAKLNPVTLGIINPIKNDIQLFPNPTKNFLNVLNYDNEHYKINDLMGRELEDGITNGRIDVSYLPKGLYILCFGDISLKFIKD